MADIVLEENESFYVPARPAYLTEEPAPVYVGTPGGGEAHLPFEYQMPVAQTTAVFEHPLGYDPVAVQVLVNGVVCDEYDVSYPQPTKTVMVGFDVPVRARIRIY